MFSDCIMDWTVWSLVPVGGEIFCLMGWVVWRLISGGGEIFCVVAWTIWRWIPGGCEIFCTDKGFLELLHNAYWIFLEVKQLVCAVDHPSHSTAKVKEKEEL